VKELVSQWWNHFPSGHEAFLAQRNALCQSTGSILRIDHSYKYVKTMGVTEEGKWVTSLS